MPTSPIPTPILLTAKRASFRLIKDEILRRVTQGQWGPGTLLPGEIELAHEFGASRATVNRALGELSAAGVLERRRKAGTRVRLQPLRQARFEIPLVRAEIEAGGALYGYALKKRCLIRVPTHLRNHFKLPKQARLLHLICLHFADGVPYQLEERWINVAAVPEVSSADFSTIGPNEWLVGAVPYSDVEISFFAAPAEALSAKYLQYNEAEAVFMVERTTWWAGQTLTHVRLSFRKDHRVTTRY